MVSTKKIFLPLVVLTAMPLWAEPEPGINPGPGTRYATDAYPAFENSDAAFRPEKKTPRWFSWWFGPKKDTAAEQFAWCRQCESEEDWSAARKGYDALVREWPTAPEAPVAQRRLADLWLVKEQDYEEAFSEYRYLLDFYSLECGYEEVAGRLYQVAELMRAEGKTIIFFRFKNTADVRRAYESVVLRSPGAEFAPKALLTIGRLREDEGKDELAVAVYENLRNLHPDTEEAREALYSEARVRVRILESRAYNRSRTADTIEFLKMARGGDLTPDMRAEVERWLVEVKNMLAEEAYQAAKFYDSRTRTVRSAIGAYEKFIEDYPESPHVAEATERLSALKEAK